MKNLWLVTVKPYLQEQLFVPATTEVSEQLVGLNSFPWLLDYIAHLHGRWSGAEPWLASGLEDAERSAYVSEYYAAVIRPDLWLENSRGVLQLQARNDVYFQAAVPTAWLSDTLCFGEFRRNNFLFCFHLSHESREDLVRSTRMLFRNFKAYSLREM